MNLYKVYKEFFDGEQIEEYYFSLDAAAARHAQWSANDNASRDEYRVRTIRCETMDDPSGIADNAYVSLSLPPCSTLTA